MSEASDGRTVDEVYKQLCTQDEVVIDEPCARVRILPKQGIVRFEELPKCNETPSETVGVVERAKQMIFRDLYHKIGCWQFVGRRPRISKLLQSGQTWFSHLRNS